LGPGNGNENSAKNNNQEQEEMQDENLDEELQKGVCWVRVALDWEANRGWVGQRGCRRSRSKNNGAANIADDQTATQASNGVLSSRRGATQSPSRKIQK